MVFQLVSSRLLAWVLITKTSYCRAFNHAALEDSLDAEMTPDHIELLQKGLQLNRKSGKCSSLHNLPEETQCPQPSWVAAMVEADPSPNKIILDVGCNKGNDMMLWMERYDTGTAKFWNTSRWVSYIKNESNVKIWACPAETFVPSRSTLFRDERASQLTGVCIEPMQANVNVLLKARKELGYEVNTSAGSLRVVQAALANPVTDEITMFPYGVDGKEDAGITSTEARMVPVKLSTVDRIVADLELPRVDILTITEGADPLVILGASSTLASVNYLTFEVHRDLTGTAWNNTTLYSVIRPLHERGFDCYWAGNNGDLLSLNNCWFDKYEKGVWANVACAKRDHVWGKVLAAHQSECCCPTYCEENSEQECWRPCKRPMPDTDVKLALD
jgi:hypothetical protein